MPPLPPDSMSWLSPLIYRPRLRSVSFFFPDMVMMVVLVMPRSSTGLAPAPSRKSPCCRPAGVDCVRGRQARYPTPSDAYSSMKRCMARQGPWSACERPTDSLTTSLPRNRSGIAIIDSVHPSPRRPLYVVGRSCGWRVTVPPTWLRTRGDQ